MCRRCALPCGSATRPSSARPRDSASSLPAAGAMAGSTANAPEQEKALERQGEVHLDHLRGIQEHYTELSLALGRKTKRGREAKMAAHLAEAAADAIELLLP